MSADEVERTASSFSLARLYSSKSKPTTVPKARFKDENDLEYERLAQELTSFMVKQGSIRCFMTYKQYWEISMKHIVRNCKDFEASRFKPGYTSPKLDGVRAFYYPGETLLASRQNKPIYGMSHIIDELRGWPHPLDMELDIPGMEFNELSGIVRNHAETPEVNANIFDSPGPGVLKERFLRIPQSSTSILRVPHYHVATLEQFLGTHSKFLHLGYEGSVWKSLDHTYLKNQRDWDWMREVPIASEDCRVLDVYEGKGKMAGILGGFIVDFNGIECKVGTLKGCDYACRREIWENPDQYIGLVIEVQYKNLQPSGKPRQPRMKGFRYDKS